MKQITELTNQPNQKYTIVLDNNETVDLVLTYSDNQQCWFCDINYKQDTFICNGIRVVSSPNILHQWKNVIPFGIAIITNDKTDPYFINDFSTNRVGLFILNADDVDFVSSNYINILT
jgi:hypothetical protein